MHDLCRRVDDFLRAEMKQPSPKSAYAAASVEPVPPAADGKVDQPVGRPRYAAIARKTRGNKFMALLALGMG